MNIGDWTERFTGTSSLPTQVRDRLVESARVLKFPAGKLIFSPHNIPDNLLFLVEGTIRVTHSSDNGRDIVLCRVEAGESCVLTTACMLQTMGQIGSTNIGWSHAIYRYLFHE